ncbi:glycosyltransferase family 2 protein [Microbacterium sp. RD1]|uniref:glycosyltransferase family 2 protein n=1 Tax=Microbacterium sp. RD1 TaxID=3457313 RepID=UPI003FA60863
MDVTHESLQARAAELVAARIPASIVGGVAHRTASSRAQALLDLVAEQTGEPGWLAAAGYERGTRATTSEEVRLATSQLMRAVESARLPARYQVLLAELLILLGDDARISRLLRAGKLRGLGSTRERMLDADLANPFRTPGLPEQKWLQTVQALFGDLAPLALTPVPEGDGYEPIDRLTTQLEPGTVGGDLVSVIISSYRPDSALDTAVRSILAQTWADLEVLVVDDASGPEFSHVFARVAALDERVRVIHQPRNGGTYVARNTAIDQARGTYVTFQDADDWSHPERIERQTAVFERDPLVHSVRAQSLRTSGSLVFSRQGTAVRAPAAATIMFRRDRVWPVLGGYDEVRKAADTEFHERMVAALPGYTIDLDIPLMWVRLGEGSLSRSEFRASWKHPARFLYRSAFTHWHDQIRRGASPRLDRAVRSFPAPRRFHLDQAVPPEEFDLVVLGDWRGDGSAALDAIEWIRLLAADGIRVALVHAESLNFEGRRAPGLMAPVQELVAAGTVKAVPWDESVTTSSIVVLEPEVLEYLPDTEPGANAPALVVLWDATSRPTHAIGTAEALVRRRWGVPTVWSPRGAAAEAALRHASGEVLDRPFPPIIPREVRRPLHRPRPVVVVAPLGIAPDVLDETARLSSALAAAGLDVRVPLAEGARVAVRRRGGAQSPAVLWRISPAEAAATAAAIATDLVIVGPASGIEFDRLVDDARVWGVRTHLPGPGHHPEAAGGRGYEDLIKRILTPAPIPSDILDPNDQAATEAAVRSWFEKVSTLA